MGGKIKGFSKFAASLAAMAFFEARWFNAGPALRKRGLDWAMALMETGADEMGQACARSRLSEDEPNLAKALEGMAPADREKAGRAVRELGAALLTMDGAALANFFGDRQQVALANEALRGMYVVEKAKYEGMDLNKRLYGARQWLGEYPYEAALAFKAMLSRAPEEEHGKFAPANERLRALSERARLDACVPKGGVCAGARPAPRI